MTSTWRSQRSSMAKFVSSRTRAAALAASASLRARSSAGESGGGAGASPRPTRSSEIWSSKWAMTSFSSGPSFATAARSEDLSIGSPDAASNSAPPPSAPALPTDPPPSPSPSPSPLRAVAILRSFHLRRWSASSSFRLWSTATWSAKCPRIWATSARDSLEASRSARRSTSATIICMHSKTWTRFGLGTGSGRKSSGWARRRLALRSSLGRSWASRASSQASNPPRHPCSRSSRTFRRCSQRRRRHVQQ
mmetsp:Transcript_46562/g.105214  ORF Transcript_46562/g.105214 Transcript_46562/m.105214 type:complete len:250 (-) Transcript_46562:544-1293(-)